MVAKEMLQWKCESLGEERLFYDWVWQDKWKGAGEKGKPSCRGVCLILPRSFRVEKVFFYLGSDHTSFHKVDAWEY